MSAAISVRVRLGHRARVPLVVSTATLLVFLSSSDVPQALALPQPCTTLIMYGCLLLLLGRLDVRQPLHGQRQ